MQLQGLCVDARALSIIASLYDSKQYIIKTAAATVMTQDYAALTGEIPHFSQLNRSRTQCVYK